VPEAPYEVRHASGPIPAELCAVESLLARPGTTVLKESPRVTVARARIDDRDLVFKRFRDHTVTRGLVVAALGSSAARVWRAATLMRNAGFSVPEPVAALERRRFGIALRSCAVVCRVAGPALDDLWRSRGGGARRRLTLAFADYLRRLHAAGLYPQDLRAANVVVAREDPPEFVLVDLDRVRRYRRLSWRRRRKNLVQVHRSVGRGAPLRDSVRFLRRYLGVHDRGELRRLAGEINALGARKDREYARRRAAGARA